MDGCPIRTAAFVNEMRAGMRNATIFTMEVPRHFTDGDIQLAAHQLHQAGYVVSYGLTHNGNRFALAKVAMRTCTRAGYLEWRRSEAHDGTKVAFVAAALITLLIGWIYSWGNSGIICGAIVAATWITVMLFCHRTAAKIRTMTVPEEPESCWIPYWDWH